MPIRTTYEKQEKVFLPSRMPVLLQTEANPYAIDKELKRLKNMMIQRTPENREECFKMESIIVSFVTMTSAVTIGDGVRVRCDNDKALKVIKEWNSKINVKKKTVDGLIEDSFFDNIIHGNSYYRIVPESPYYDNVDVQRMDPKTITIREDPIMGYRKFIQHLGKYKHYKKKQQFYRKAGHEDSTIKGLTKYGTYNIDKVDYGEGFDHLRYNNNYTDIEIPDEPYRILHINLFREIPMDTALRYVVYKSFVLWFMRKYSQKYWAPFVIAKIGDPKSTNYPNDPAIMQKSIEKVSAVVKNMTAFGYITVPGDVDIKTLETGTAKSAEIYPMYIHELDRQMMYAVFGSMGIREARGNELATSRTLEQIWLRLIKGLRRKFELVLKNFYVYCLLPYSGIKDVKFDDIDIEWSRLTLESPKELMDTISLGFEIGIFKDLNEMRKAAQIIFPFLEQLPKGEGSVLPKPIKQQTQDAKLEKIFKKYVDETDG